MRKFVSAPAILMSSFLSAAGFSYADDQAVTPSPSASIFDLDRPLCHSEHVDPVATDMTRHLKKRLDDSPVWRMLISQYDRHANGRKGDAAGAWTICAVRDTTYEQFYTQLHQSAENEIEIAINVAGFTSLGPNILLFTPVNEEVFTNPATQILASLDIARDLVLRDPADHTFSADDLTRSLQDRAILSLMGTAYMQSSMMLQSCYVADRYGDRTIYTDTVQNFFPVILERETACFAMVKDKELLTEENMMDFMASAMTRYLSDAESLETLMIILAEQYAEMPDPGIEGFAQRIAPVEEYASYLERFGMAHLAPEMVNVARRTIKQSISGPAGPQKGI